MIPVFAGRMIPSRVRVFLALLMGVLILPTLQGKGLLPPTFADLTIAFMKEIIVGLMMGFAIHMVFFAVEFGGEIMASEISLTRGSTFDLQTHEHRSGIALLLFNFAMLLFFITGMHREMLYAIVKSYECVPYGLFGNGFGNIELILKATSNVFLLGVRMAAPMIALNFVVTVTFAILGKAAPNFNVFVVSFAARILAGLMLLSLVVGLLTQYILTDMRQGPTLMLKFLLRE
ncbi:MAG: hypothetical protein A2Y14_02020 [Verrucomicrobia bacterium GWF2_51_19]|nr:MAG: hypothetical protein A2Y14_02020 [Verrucomicrobia bacterium GWF2_51_19]